MFVFFILLLALLLCGIKLNKSGFYAEYISKDQCNAIKGVFILVVFMRHVVPYVIKAGYEMDSLLDRVYNVCDVQIGQLLVVMFLFYSGYGVMESYKKKGDEYIEGFPKKRILTTLLNFDMAVLMFLILDLCLNIELDVYQIVLSFVAWDSIGNSNWYIFIILVCYIVTFFSFRRYRQNIGGGIFFIVIVSLILIGLLYFAKRPKASWYNTILCYPAGMYFSVYKNKTEEWAEKNYTKSLMTSFLLFFIIHIANLQLPSYVNAYSYNVESIIFTFLVVLLTMKVHVGNKMLYWFGLNLFPLYIYQRIPMVSIREIAGQQWLCDHPYFYVVICLIVSVLLAYLYKFWKLSI